MKKIQLLLIIILTSVLPYTLFAQRSNDTLQGNVTLQQCIVYALRSQPAVRQASIDEEINEKDIRIGLAGWLPQVNSSGSYQHYFQGSPVNSAGSAALPASGTSNSEFSSLGLQASQVIYNNDVLLAAKTANYSRLYYKQNTVSSQINVVSDVSKAFFDVLLSQKQLDILNEDITRLQRSLKDAYNRYQAGVSDKDEQDVGEEPAFGDDL